MNSQIRAMIGAAPHIQLPLLSSRLVIKRSASAARAAGPAQEDLLASLEAAHMETLDLRSEGESARHAEAPAGSVPTFERNRRLPSLTTQVTKLAAAALARFVQA